MKDDFKNILLAGIGSAAYTYEKASKFLDEMIQKGKITIDEGKELSEELKRNVKAKQNQFADKVLPVTKDDLSAILKELDLPTKSEFEDLKNRLSAVEKKLNQQ